VARIFDFGFLIVDLVLGRSPVFVFAHDRRLNRKSEIRNRKSADSVAGAADVM